MTNGNLRGQADRDLSQELATETVLVYTVRIHFSDLRKVIMTSSHRVHFFHLIWSTKGRKDLILPKMQEELYAYIGGVVRKCKGSLLEIGGIANHLHLLVELSNLDHFTALIRNTKTASSAWLKEAFLECGSFAWQDGYGSFSVSTSQIEHVREYIRTQEHHHKKISFEEEYVKLLTLNRVNFDDRYLFD